MKPPGWSYDEPGVRVNGRDPAFSYLCDGCGTRLHRFLIENGETVHNAACQAKVDREQARARARLSMVPNPGKPEIPVGRAHPATAWEMATRVRGVRRDVMRALIAQPGTDFDLEDRLGRTHQSVSGARRQLVLDGFVEDSGQTRINKHGNRAIVWRVRLSE